MLNFLVTIIAFISFANSQNVLLRNYNKINLVLDSVQVMVEGIAIDKDDLDLSNRYKIITIINGNCYKCFAQIQVINNLIDSIDNHYKYSYLTFVHGDNFDPFKRFIEDNMTSYKHPLIYDKRSVFERANHEVINDGYTVFLLNTNDEIIAMDFTVTKDFIRKVVTHSQSHPVFIDSPPIYIKPIKYKP